MRFFAFLFVTIFVLIAQAKDPVIVAVVDAGVASNDIKQLRPYMVPGWDFGYDNRSMGIDYDEFYKKEYHGTIIAAQIISNIKKSKLRVMDIVYKDYTGKKFRLHEYPYAGSMLELYRRKKIYEKFSEHLRDVFRYAKENKAEVINFSSSDAKFYADELKDWIKQNPEVVLVVSAGNDGDDLDKFPQYPCGYEQVICVGAVDKNKKTEYTNYGSPVTIYAQGNYSEDIQGTSFSAPVVSRAAALIKYRYPNWKFKEVRSEILRYSYFKNGLRIFHNEKFMEEYNR